MPKMTALFTLLVLSLANPAPPGPSDLLPDQDGMLGVLGTHSSKPMQAGAITLSESGRLLHGISLVDGGHADMSGKLLKLEDCLIGHSRTFLSLGLGYGFDVSLGLPVYYEKIPGMPGDEENLDAGDPSLFIKYAFPGWNHFTTFAVFTQFSAPTSAGNQILPKEFEFVPIQNAYPDPYGNPIGLKVPGFNAGGAMTLDLTDLTDGSEALLHLNVSGSRPLTTQPDPFGTVRISVASEISPLQGLRLQAELQEEILLARLSDLSHPQGQAGTINLGLGLALGRSFSLQGGAILAPPALNPEQILKRSTPQGLQTVKYRFFPTASVFVGIAWRGFPFLRDTDHDGVPDGKDNCPSIPEDVDGFQDEDGCPDFDNDHDGIPDQLDQCPYAAEDFDGFEDRDGCPDVDNDRDGILEDKDKCPNDTEDKDGFQDEDGCPDLDNDQDGIPDSQDKCPIQPENFNGVEDKDGCPEIDRDGDGVPDQRDQCPNEKEIINFFEDEDGCPDEKPAPIRDGVLVGVDFSTGTADLLPSADSILKALALRLLAYPGTEIEIQAHIDDLAGPKAVEITQARAEAVADALNKLGIELRRIKRKGFGYKKPISSNRTANGRKINRRIEIRRLN